MNALRAIVRSIDRLNGVVGYVTALSILGLIGLVSYEVFLRYVVKAPTTWGNELISFIFAGYILLGAIVERHTRASLGAGVRDLLGFERLGLQRTWFETLEPSPQGLPERVHQYMNGVDTYGHDPSLDLYGGGGIAATIDDVAAFFSALLPSGIRIVTGSPMRRPASAIDWPWLPRVAVMTPAGRRPERASQSI